MAYCRKPLSLTLRQLKGVFLNVNLFVTKDQAFATDVILGREFFLEEKLTLIYRQREATNDEMAEKIALLVQLPLNVAEDCAEDINRKITNSDIDFGWREKKQ